MIEGLGEPSSNACDEREIVFVAGLHRSGTSLLHHILCEHPEVSGFSNTGVSEDEGQLLQSAIPPAWFFGGPGRFGFDPRSHMDESHPLATGEVGEKMFGEWSPHWDLSKGLLVEKSPPNLVRTRFLQSIFPKSRFVTLIRHPVPVSLSTQRLWNSGSFESLLEHWLKCHEKFFDDMAHLARVHVVRYEDLVTDYRKTVGAIHTFLGLETRETEATIDPVVNHRYFEQWRALPQRDELAEQFDHRFEPFGYSLRDL